MRGKNSFTRPSLVLKNEFQCRYELAASIWTWMTKSVAIRLGGYRSSAWVVAGHHRITRLSWKLVCHTNANSLSHVSYPNIGRQVRFSDNCEFEWFLGLNLFMHSGCGRSKKIAKRLAAHKMCQKLQDISMEGSQICDEDGNYEVNLNISQQFSFAYVFNVFLKSSRTIFI